LLVWHNLSVTESQFTRTQREAHASEQLAEQLDALSRPMADRVLGRAIELDHVARLETDAAAETIDYETLKEIALEVGISEKALKKALLEEFNTERDHKARPLEKATAPDTIRGGLIVDGVMEAVTTRLRDYLESQEGLRDRGGSEIHRMFRPPGRSSGPQVDTWTVTQARPDKQLVEVDVDTAAARKRAMRWIVGLVILGMVFGSNLGGLFVLGVFVAGIVSVVGWAKRIVRRARRRVNKALGSLVDDAGGASGWLELWERSRR
jgi:hypothetical protein